ncbi:MAG: YDG domain-containing protein, partial [Saprospiraceae bacterium]|nr:YDG domain-containing protein [Saprospiraceae bacterium]
DPATNNTVLDGDIGVLSDETDNAYHVVSADNITSATILDGFTITNGNSDGVSGHGGGIYLSGSNGSSPTLANLIISNNLANSNGAGLYSITVNNLLPEASYSRPSLTDVTFSGNTAARGGGMHTQNSSAILTRVVFSNNTATGGAGGGMNNQTLLATDAPSIPILTDVTFDSNIANGGGGMFNANSNGVLNNVTFYNNTAYRRGGAVLNENASPSFTNVTFYGNTSTETVGAAPWGGGAVLNFESSPTFNNTTFSGNNSLTQAGDAIRNTSNSSPQISNSIFWGDTTDEIASDGTGSTTIVDSVVEGGFTGTNILTTDPNLGSLADNGGFTETMALGVGSSAINTGGVNAACASTDQRGTSRPQGAACDIGAYEFDGANTLTVSPVTDTYGNTVNLTASLVSYGAGVNGKTINFTLNGSSVGNAVTNSSGVATLNAVSLVGIDAGTYPGGVNSGVGASFAGDSIFVASSDTDTLTINQRPITVTAASDSKEYDGNSNSSGVPSITSGSLASGDTATWTQSFDNKNAGTGKTLTPAGSVSDGNSGNNYTVTFATNTTGVITAKELTVSGITANNKVYDGNTSATLNTGSAALNGVLGGDTVSLNTGSAVGTFDDPNVGTGKTVTVSGLTLSGADAGNYSLTQPTTTADITAKELTVSGITANNKVYDGNTSATFNTGSAALVGVLGGDTVSLNTGSAVGTFDDPNVGTGKTVTVSGL